MARVLVTGGNGFIGAHLVRSLLKRGDEVRCLVRRTSSLSHLQGLDIKLVYGDVLNPDSLREAVDQTDLVLHLAGATKVLHKQEFWDVNEGGVRNLLTACAAQETPPVVVSTSSLAASRPAKEGVPITEDMPPAPVSNYGRSKLSGELAAAEFAARVPITILRPPMVYGEGDFNSLSMYRPIVRWGVHYGPGLRKARFSMIHADDLSRAILLAAEKGKRLSPNPPEPGVAPPGIYFAAGDEHPTFKEWGRAIADAFGRKRLLVITPFGGQLLWPIGLAGDIVARIRRKPSLMNIDKAREIFAGSWWCSDAALRRDTGFAPAANLLARLQQTADWFRREGYIK